MERTFLLVKPDGVMRGLIGEVVTRLERKGLNIAALKILMVSKSQSEALYSMHQDKGFYPQLIRHITSAPVAVMVIEGPNCIQAVRRMVGATDPQEAAPGSIRADFALNTTQNIVHAADSMENAEREIQVFFKPDEILSYSKPTETKFLHGTLT